MRTKRLGLQEKKVRIVTICLLLCIIVSVSTIVAYANDAAASFNESNFKNYVVATGSASGDGKTSSWSDGTYKIGAVGAGAQTRTKTVTFTPQVDGIFGFKYTATSSMMWTTIKVNGVDHSNLSGSEDGEVNTAVGKVQVSASVSAKNSSKITADVKINSIYFIPYHAVNIVSADGGTYTCLKNGTATTQTEFKEPGVTVTASSISDSATTYTLSASVSAENSENYTYQGWQVSTDGVNWTPVTPNSDAFPEWKTDAEGNYLFTPAGDWYIKPYFVKNEIETTFRSVAGGSYSVNTSEGTLDIAEKTADSGADQTSKELKSWEYEITATPKSGYYLVGYEVFKGEGITSDYRYIVPTQSSYTFSAEKGEAFTVDGEYTVYPLFVEAITVKFKAPPAGVSSYTVSATLNGKTALSATITSAQEITIPKGSTISLTATTNTDYAVSGWEKDGALWSSEPSASKVLDTNATIGPLAAEDTGAYYIIVSDSETYTLSTWEQAMTLAHDKGVANSKNIRVVILKDVTLPTTLSANGLPAVGGNYVKMVDGKVSYEVPSNVKFVLPYGTDYTVCEETKTADLTSLLNYANRAFIRSGPEIIFNTQEGLNVTLTVPQGTHVEVSGVLSVGGTIYATSGNSVSGAPAGAHANVQLDGSMNVANNAKLSVLGYILGNGTVTIENGGRLYELFTITDYRSGGYTVCAAGGDTYSMGTVGTTSEKYVSPFLRYAMANVQTSLRINNGGRLTGYSVMFTDAKSIISARYNVCEFEIIGNMSTALINTTGGDYVDIDYDATTKVSIADFAYSYVPGKATVSVNGGGSLGTSKLEVSIAGDILKADINTNELTFPIPYNIDLHLLTTPGESSAQYTIAGPLAVLPGATMYVGEDAVLTLASDGVEDSVDHFIVLDGLNDHTRTDPTAAYDSQFMFRYPDTAELNQAAFNYGTGALIVDGKLVINDTVSFGGTVQTNGSGEIHVGSSAELSATTQIGLAGTKNIAGSDYQYGGATVRTLNAQIRYADGTVKEMEAGEIYYGVDNRNHPVDSYTYTLYTMYNYNASTGDGIETHTETLNAQNIGSWCTTPGHNYDEGVATDPTCNKAGYTTYTCADCGYSYDEEIQDKPATGIHEDEDGNLVCDTENCGAGLVKLLSMNVNADAKTELVLEFYVNENYATATSDTVFANVTFADSTPRQISLKNNTNSNTVECVKAEVDENGNATGNYILTVIQPVASAQMTLPVTVSFQSEGENVCIVSNSEGVCQESVSKAVIDYAKLILQQPDETHAAAKKLVTALVTYGGYAQLYYGVDSANPAYNILDSATLQVQQNTVNDTTIPADVFDRIKNESPTGITLTQEVFLDAAIAQNVYFTLEEGYAIADYSFELTYMSGKVEYTKDFVPSLVENTTNKYVLLIDNIPSGYLDYDYKITITNSTGEKVEVYPSVMAGLIAMMEETLENPDARIPLAKAMYLYALAASEFFDK